MKDRKTDLTGLTVPHPGAAKGQSGRFPDRAPFFRGIPGLLEFLVQIAQNLGRASFGCGPMPEGIKEVDNMPKRKRKLTTAEKRARRERKRKYMTIFIHGKQKRVPRPPEIEGLPVDEFIARNADPIWLHQHEMWELIHPDDEN